MHYVFKKCYYFTAIIVYLLSDNDSDAVKCNCRFNSCYFTLDIIKHKNKRNQSKSYSDYCNFYCRDISVFLDIP
jgi:hypothetical protein